MAARLSTRKITTPKESRNLIGSWLRMSRLKLLVPSAADRVDQAHYRHDVGQVVARHYLLEKLHVDEARVAVVDPVGRVRSVGDNVHGELAARALHPPEAVALGRPQTSPEIPENLALRHLLQALLDELDALQTLPDPDPVRSSNVARRVGYHVELQLGVDAVRVVKPDVEVHAGAPQRRPGQTHLKCLLRGQLPDAAGARDEDLVTLDQVHEVGLEMPLQTLDVLPDLLRHALWQIGLDAPDADVVEHHPRPGDRLEDVLDPFPLPEGVQDRRERAEFEHQEAYGGDVARQPHELAHENPDVLRPRWYLDVQQVLDRQTVPVLVEHVGEVVEPVSERDDRWV